MEFLFIILLVVIVIFSELGRHGHRSRSRYTPKEQKRRKEGARIRAEYFRKQEEEKLKVKEGGIKGKPQSKKKLTVSKEIRQREEAYRKAEAEKYKREDIIIDSVPKLKESESIMEEKEELTLKKVREIGEKLKTDHVKQEKKLQDLMKKIKSGEITLEDSEEARQAHKEAVELLKQVTGE